MEIKPWWWLSRGNEAMRQWDNEGMRQCDIVERSEIPPQRGDNEGMNEKAFVEYQQAEDSKHWTRMNTKLRTSNSEHRTQNQKLNR